MRPLTSRPPCALCVSARGVSSLTWTAQCGSLSSRSSAPSASPCGTPTTTASSSRLETDGMPSSWKRSALCETTHSPLRKGCLTWRYGGRNDVSLTQCPSMPVAATIPKKILDQMLKKSSKDFSTLPRTLHHNLMGIYLIYLFVGPGVDRITCFKSKKHYKLAYKLSKRWCYNHPNS